MTKTRNRTFLDMNGRITGLAASLKYPDPKFFERGNLRMSHDELRGLIHRNADEMERVIALIRSSAAAKVLLALGIRPRVRKNDQADTLAQRQPAPRHARAC